MPFLDRFEQGAGEAEARRWRG
ncbi:MAG: hypothetical protein QOJ62_2658, partial [Actinomycetota bacterium]|nr:hypothetical protein [Actinomycetota bacterium]